MHPLGAAPVHRPLQPESGTSQHSLTDAQAAQAPGNMRNSISRHVPGSAARPKKLHFTTKIDFGEGYGRGQVAPEYYVQSG